MRTEGPLGSLPSGIGISSCEFDLKCAEQLHKNFLPKFVLMSRSKIEKARVHGSFESTMVNRKLTQTGHSAGSMRCSRPQTEEKFLQEEVDQ